MKKPSTSKQIRYLKSEVDGLDKEARIIGQKLAQAEIDLTKTREALSIANRKLADAAADARQWQARFDQVLTAISKR